MVEAVAGVVDGLDGGGAGVVRRKLVMRGSEVRFIRIVRADLAVVYEPRVSPPTRECPGRGGFGAGDHEPDSPPPAPLGPSQASARLS